MSDTNQNQSNNFLSLSEASKQTGYHQDYLGFLARTGKLNAQKIGRNWVTTQNAIDDLMKQGNGRTEIVDETGNKIPVHVSKIAESESAAEAIQHSATEVGQENIVGAAINTAANIQQSAPVSAERPELLENDLQNLKLQVITTMATKAAVEAVEQNMLQRAQEQTNLSAIKSAAEHNYETEKIAKLETEVDSKLKSFQLNYQSELNALVDKKIAQAKRDGAALTAAEISGAALSGIGSGSETVSGSDTNIHDGFDFGAAPTLDLVGDSNANDTMPVVATDAAAEDQQKNKKRGLAGLVGLLGLFGAGAASAYAKKAGNGNGAANTVVANNIHGQSPARANLAGMNLDKIYKSFQHRFDFAKYLAFGTAALVAIVAAGLIYTHVYTTNQLAKLATSGQLAAQNGANGNNANSGGLAIAGGTGNGSTNGTGSGTGISNQPTGSQSNQKIIYVVGKPGPQGPPGAAGTPGPAGAQGSQGPQGASGNVTGYVPPYSGPYNSAYPPTTIIAATDISASHMSTNTFDANTANIGDLSISGNFLQSGSGTFQTGTGAVNLNGDTTIGAGKLFTLGGFGTGPVSAVDGSVYYNNVTNSFHAFVGGSDVDICTSASVACGATGPIASTLQDGYNNSTDPELVLNSSNGALTIRDAATPLGANLLEVQSNNGATTYFAVDATGAKIGAGLALQGAGALNVTAGGVGALTLNSANQTTASTNSGVVSIVTGNASGATSNSGAITIDTGTATGTTGTISIGAANASALTIGNSGSTTTLNGTVVANGATTLNGTVTVSPFTTAGIVKNNASGILSGGNTVGLTTDISGVLPIANGGTNGTATPTAGALAFGNGAGYAFTAAGATGQLLTSAGAGTPTFQNLSALVTAGTNINISGTTNVTIATVANPVFSTSVTTPLLTSSGNLAIDTSAANTISIGTAHATGITIGSSGVTTTSAGALTSSGLFTASNGAAVSGGLTVNTGTVTITPFGVAGFVKNNASGVLSGGNSLAAGDIPTSDLVSGTGIALSGTLTNRLVGSGANVTVNVGTNVPTSVTNDTNITGTISANVLTLGFTGQLSVARGGTGLATLGAANQILAVNSAGTANVYRNASDFVAAGTDTSLSGTTTVTINNTSTLQSVTGRGASSTNALTLSNAANNITAGTLTATGGTIDGTTIGATVATTGKFTTATATTVNATTALQLGGANINTAGTLSNVAYQNQANNFSGLQTFGAGLTVSAGAVTITPFASAGIVKNNASGVLSGGNTIALTGDVSGVLPIANGGTNGTATPTAGAIAFGNGTAYAFTAAGTSNQILTSGGAGTPTFQNVASLATAGTNIALSGTTNLTIGTVANPTFTTSVTSPIVNATTTLELGGTDINTAGTLSNVAYKNAANTYTSGTQTFNNGLTIAAGQAVTGAGALTVTTGANNTALTLSTFNSTSSASGAITIKSGTTTTSGNSGNVTIDSGTAAGTAGTVALGNANASAITIGHSGATTTNGGAFTSTGLTTASNGLTVGSGAVTITPFGTAGLVKNNASGVLSGGNQASLTSDVSGILPIANGGTNTNSQTTNGVAYFDGTKVTTGTGVTYDPSSFNTFSLTGSNAARTSIVVQNTNGNGNASFYFQNDRGSFATYGGLLTGGSTDTGAALFGLGRADRTFLFSDGTSSLGFATGTLTAEPYVIGTNNTEQLRVAANGNITVQTLKSGATAPTTSGTTKTVVTDANGELSFIPTTSGTVTSVDGSGGTTGLTLTGGPITSSGTLTLGGTLKIANGGTNGTATPTAGAIAFGTGTAFNFTAAGTSNQLLTSAGAGTPTFQNISALLTAGTDISFSGTTNVTINDTSTLQTVTGRGASSTNALTLSNASNAITAGTLTATGGTINGTTIGQSTPAAGSFTSLAGTTVNASTAFQLGGANINTSGTLSNVAYLLQDQTFSGRNTLTRSGTGTTDYTFGVTGAPVADATSSLIRIGGAIASGNAVTNGGTYLGLNEPLTGVGSTADFINFQRNGIAKLTVDNAGNITAGNFTGGSLTVGAIGSGAINSSSTISGTTITGTTFVDSGLTINKPVFTDGSDNLTSSGTVPVANGGTGANSLTVNGVLYGNGTSLVQATAQGGSNTILVANNGAPSFSSAVTIGTSVTSPTLNASVAIELGGADINTAGTLSNVAYKNAANTYTSGTQIFNNGLTIASGQSVHGAAALTLDSASGNVVLQPAGSGTTASVQIGAANGGSGSANPDVLVLDKSSGSLPTGVNGALVVDSSGKFNIFENGTWKVLCNTTDQACGTGTGSALNAITPATAANSINNGNNAQTWNWALTSSSKTAFTFGEASAATGANDELVRIGTASGSTAAPLHVVAGGNDALFIDTSANVAIGSTTAAAKLDVTAGAETAIKVSTAVSQSQLMAYQAGSLSQNIFVDGSGLAHYWQYNGTGAVQNEFNVGGASFFGSGPLGVGNSSPSALLTLGTAGTTAGSLSLAGSTSGVVTILTKAAAGTYTLTLPDTDGNPGEFLSTDGSGVLSWAASTVGASGADTDVQFNDGGAFGGVNQFTFQKTTGTLTLAPTARTSGTPSVFVVTTPADTTLAASTESTSVKFNLSATRQFSAGALTTQREALIQAPTYAFTGASTITNAATFAISGAPTAGTNASITNDYALWVQGGQSEFDGNLVATGNVTQTGSGTFGTGTGNVSLNGNTTVAAGKTFNVGSGLSTLAGGLTISAGTVTISPFGTAGIVKNNASGVLTGGNSVALTTDVSGVLPIANGGTNGSATPTAGAIAFGNGTAYAFSAAGTSNQILTSGGTGTPTFQNIASLATAGTNIALSGTTNLTIGTVANPVFSTSVTSPLYTSTSTLAVTAGGTGTLALSTTSQSASSTSSANITLFTGNATGTTSNSGSVTIDSGTATGTAGVVALGNANASAITIGHSGATTTNGGAFTSTGLTTASNGLTVGSGAVTITPFSTAGIVKNTASGVLSGGNSVSLTSDISGILPVPNGGTGQNALTTNGVLYGNNTSAVGITAQGGANTVLVANAGTPSFSSAITVGTSVTSPIINGSTTLELGGTDINTAGTLSNVAYKNAANTFTLANTFSRNGTGTGDYTLGVTGTPINDGTSSLVRIGSAIASGNAATNGGTYLGINEPASGAGSAADFFNFQNNGASVLKLSSTGILAQTYSSGTASSAHTQSVTNTNAGASSIAVNGSDLTLVGTATSSGTNTNSAIKFENPTAATNNVFYALNFGGTGYTDILHVGSSQIINGSGVLQSAGLSGTYSNALTLSNAGNAITAGTLTATGGTIDGTTIGATTPATGKFTTLNSTGLTTAGTGLTVTTGSVTVTPFTIAGIVKNNASGVLSGGNTVSLTSDISGVLPIANGGTNGTATPTAGALAFGNGTSYAFTAAGTSNQLLTSAGAGTPTFQNISALATAGTNIALSGTTNLTIGTVANPVFSTSVTSPLYTSTSNLAVTAGGTGTVAISTTATGTASTNSGAITINSGNATGTTSNSGAITIDSGTATGTAGVVALGNTNASAVTIGHSGVTTTNGGAFTSTGLVTANGGVTVGANQNLTLNSGTGVLGQTYTNGAAGSAETKSVTNTNAGGSSIAVNGTDLTLVGTATSGGTNTNSAIKFENPTAATNNVFYALNFGGTGYTDILHVGSSQIINGSGVLQSAGLSGTYSNALTLSNAGNAITAGTLTATGGTIDGTTIGATTPATGKFTTLNSTGLTTAGTGLTVTTGSVTVTPFTIAGIVKNNASGVLSGGNTITLTSDVSGVLPIANGGTNGTATPTAGALAFGNGTAYAFTAAGTSNQLLTSAGAGTPTFQNISALATAGTNIALSGTTNLTIGTVANPTFSTSVTSPLYTSTSNLAVTAGGTGTVAISTTATGTASTNSGAITINSGNATGTTSNSGAITIDSGTATGTAGVVALGNANASAVTIGHSGATTTNGGAFTSTGLTTASNGLTVTSGAVTITPFSTAGLVKNSVSGVLSGGNQASLTADVSGILPIANGGTNGTAAPTAGAIAFGTGTAYNFTAAGTSNQILTSGGAGTPTFQNIASLLTAGTDVSITGTTNATINDTSTLQTVTGRGASSTNALTLSNVSNNITAGTLTATGGTINNTTIGQTTAVAGKFTTLNATTVIQLGGTDINSNGTLNNVAYLGASSQAFTGINTFSRNGTGTGDYTLGVTGTPVANATSSLIRVGNAIVGGNNTVTTGGTYLGINEPSTGAGSTADFFNFQNNGSSVAKLSSSGVLTVASCTGCGSGTAAGANTQVQFNDGGLLAGNSAFTFDKSTGTFSATGPVNLATSSGAFTAGNSGGAAVLNGTSVTLNSNSADITLATNTSGNINLSPATGGTIQLNKTANFAGNIIQSGTGTLSTGTGNISLNGNVALFGSSFTALSGVVSDFQGSVQINPATTSGGTARVFEVDGPANTNLTAGTEEPDINLNLARTEQFSGGALTTQRAALVSAPTYAFTSASTITNAATFAITGAPVAGTNATITNDYAFWVQAGQAEFDGNVVATGNLTQTGSGTFGTGTGNVSLNGNTTVGSSKTFNVGTGLTTLGGGLTVSAGAVTVSPFTTAGFVKNSVSGVLSGGNSVALTTDVSGVLPIANGGTNGTTTPTAGAVAYGTGSAYGFTAAGTSNQILTSAGTGTPTFQNISSLTTAGTNISLSGTTNLTIGTVANPVFSTSVTSPLYTSTSNLAVTAGGTGTLALSTTATGTASTNSGAITLTSGNATGTTSNSGAITIDSGTATGTAGVVALGNTNASAISIGHSGATTTNGGAFTSTGLTTASNGLTVTSGAVTVTPFGTAGLVKNSASGVLSGGNQASLTTDVSGILPIANGGTNNNSTYTAGSVIYSNGTSLTQDNSNFFWDGVNHRLGIGTTAPLTPLHIKSAGGAGNGIDLELTNAATYGTIDFNTPTGLIGQFVSTGSTFSNGLIGGDQTVLANLATNGALQLGADGTNGYVSFFTGGLLTSNLRLTIDKVGNVSINALKSGATAPTTSGTTKTVVTDANGLLSFIPTTSGTVTSVSGSGGTTGLTLTGGPITTSGTLTLGGTLAIANGGTNGSATPTAGAIAFGNGTAYAFTAAGTSNQILTSGGAGTPTFQNIASLLTAGTDISITGTTNATINDTSTLQTVTGRGASSTNTLTLSNATNSITAGTLTATGGTINGTTIGVTSASTGKFTTLNATTVIQLGGTDINTAGTLTNVAYKNAANTFTQNNIFQPTVTTGTGATAGLQVAANSLTTGNGIDLSSSSVTTGNVVNISSTSTAAGSNTQTALNVTTSGANGTTTQTTYGAQFSNTHTGTSSTNVGLYATASGGTNNYAAILNGGNVGIGISNPTASLYVYSNSAEDALDVRSNGGGTLTYTQFGQLQPGNNMVMGYDSNISTGAYSSNGDLNITSGYSNSVDSLAHNIILSPANGGKVGIGDSSPASLLTVGSGDLFQVNSSGAIAAATGVTSSGTITFSGLSNGIVKAASGVISGGNTVSLTSDVTGILPVPNGGTGQNALTTNGVLYGNNTSAVGITAQGGANTVLIANAGAPSFSSAITVGTSVTSPIINATTTLELGGADINTANTLSNVAYRNAANTFTSGTQTFNNGLTIAAGQAVTGAGALTVTTTGANALTLKSSNTAGSNSAAVTLQSGNATSFGFGSGDVTVDVGTTGVCICGGNLKLGATNATTVTLGNPYTVTSIKSGINTIGTTTPWTDSGSDNRATPVLTIQGAADNINFTGTANVPDVDFTLNRVITFQDGGGVSNSLPTTETAIIARAPTYATSATGTITNAATFAITGAPIAGTNATITNAMALWVQAGTTELDGNLAETAVSTFSRNGTGTGDYSLGVTGTPVANATSSLIRVGNAIASGNATAGTGGTYLGINEPSTGAGSTADFFNFQNNGSSVAKLSSTGVLTVTSCAGCSGASTAAGADTQVQFNDGGTALGASSQFTFQKTTGTLTLAPTSITTGNNGLVVNAGSGVTSGSALQVTASGTSAITNGLVQISHSGAYTGTGGLLSVTGNSTTAGTIANFSATSLTTGTGLNINVGGGVTSGSAINVAASGTSAIANGLVQISHTGAYTGSGGLLSVNGSSTSTGTVANFNGTSETTGNVVNINPGNNITSGAALNIAAAGTSAISSGLVQISHSGAYTGTGGLLNLAANSTTAGSIANISGTSLTTGVGLFVNAGSNITSGSGLEVIGTGTSAITNGLVSINHTGAFTGTGGILNVAATATTAGTVATISGTSLTTGIGLQVNAGANITSGNAVQVLGSGTSAISSGLVQIQHSGAFTGTGGLLTVQGNSSTSGRIATFLGTGMTGGQVVKILADSLTSGAGLLVTGPTGASALSSGLVQSTATGNYTGTGGLINALATTSTAGTLINFTNNTAAFTGTGETHSFTGTTTGNDLVISPGSGVTSGSALQVAASGTSAITSGLVQITHTGAYTGTGGLLNVNASASTSGRVATFNGSAMTSGTTVQINGGANTSGTVLGISGNTGTTTGATLLVTNGRASFTPTLTVASAIGATYDGVTIPATTATLTGTTGVATSTGFNLFNVSAPTITDSSAVAVTNAAAQYIGGAPVAAGLATITNSSALTIGATAVGSGVTNSFGLNVNAQTGATNNYAAAFNGGNVGIGTSTPGSTLQVVTSGTAIAPSAQTVANFQRSVVAGADANISVTSGTTGQARIYFGDTASEEQGFVSYDNNLDSLTLGAAGSSMVTVLSSGNVGIGNTAPGSLLTVGSGGLFTVDNSGNVNGNAYSIAGVNTLFTTSGNTQLRSTTGKYLSLLANNTEAVRVDTTGKVGIQNTSPSAILSLGTAGTTAGTLSLAGATSGTTTLAVPSTAGSYTFTLPPNAGTNLYVLQTDGSGVTTWVPQSGGGGTPGGSTTQVQFNDAGAFGGQAGFTFQKTTGALTLAPTARTSGSPNIFVVTSPADTGLTASTESTSVNFNTSATRTFAFGTLTTQRETLFQAPTYAFSGNSVIGTAATVAINGAPIAGSSAHINNAYALWIQSGTTELDGNLNNTGVATFSRNGTGTSDYSLGVTGTPINDAASALIRIGNAVSGGNAATNGGTYLSINEPSSSTGSAADFINLQRGGSSIYQLANGTTTASGAGAVAGMLQNLTLTNSTTSGFQFGNRLLNTVNGTVAGTEDGSFVRVTDNTTLANTVRGLEVQAYSGTNTNGTNTGITAFGKTFGIQGITTGEAGGVTAPAGVYAELQNSAAPTVGNAIRAYSSNATSATLVSIFQETSAFTGNGLQLDLGNGSGSFASGNFIDLRNAGTQKAHIDSTGAAFISLPGTQTTIALCHATNGQVSNDQIVDCSGAPSDLAENYGTVDSTIEAADVVTASGEAQDITHEGFKTSKAFVQKSSSPYESDIIGVISTQPDQTYADDIFDPSENPRPVAMVGRVPVKVSDENGPVVTGDWLTSSSVPGVAMKATQPGSVIGEALSSFTGTGVGRVEVFVHPGFHDPSLVVDANGNVLVQRDTASTIITAATNSSAAYVINQKGSGDLLQLQANGSDRLLVKNDGTVNINSSISNQTALLFTIANNGTSVFNINVRGDVQLAGTLVVPNDTFAGSVTTNADGLAEIDFSNDLGTGKPVVELTPEATSPVFAQILSWKKDGNNNYTGFTMKTFALGDGGVANGASATVQYFVVRKEDSYTTSVSTLPVVNQPNIVVQNPPAPTPPAGDTGSGAGTVAGAGTADAGSGAGSTDGSGTTTTGDGTTVGSTDGSTGGSTGGATTGGAVTGDTGSGSGTTVSDGSGAGSTTGSADSGSTSGTGTGAGSGTVTASTTDGGASAGAGSGN